MQSNQSNQIIVQGLASVLISLKKNYPELDEEVKDTVKSCQACFKTGVYADATTKLKEFAESANRAMMSGKSDQEEACFSLLEKFTGLPSGFLSESQKYKIVSLQQSIRVGGADLSIVYNSINGLLEDVSSSIDVLKEKNYGQSKVKGGFQEGVADVKHADLAVATRRIARDLTRLTEQLVMQYPDNDDILSLKAEASDLGEGSAQFFKGIDLLSRLSWALSGISEKQINADKAYVGKLAEQFKDLASVCKDQSGLNSKSQEKLSQFENEFNDCINELEDIGRNSSDIGVLKSKMLDKMMKLQSCMGEFVVEQGELLSSQSGLIEQQTKDLVENAKESEELKSQLNLASQKANEDRLTGVANRAGYEDHLEEMRKLWVSKKERVGLILLDIDHFKKVNDTYGHTVGDEVLVHLANILKKFKVKFKSKNAHVSRYGGEEFAVIVNDLSPNEVLSIARSINKTIEKTPYTNRRSGLEIKITASIGVGMFLDKSDTSERIFDGADKALYKAKSTGRNCVWIYNVKEINRVFGNSQPHQQISAK